MHNSSEKGLKKIYSFLASKGLTISLLAVLSLFLAITTAPAGDAAGVWYVIRILLVLMVINLSLCTLKRLKRLSRSVLIIHIGVILTFIGGGISSYGYVATVNIYEGSSVDKVFRWDIEQEASLGVDIMVEKLHEEYYPVPVKVGVMKDGEKHELFLLNTGESFELDPYTVMVESIDIYKKTLKLSVYDKVLYLGSAETNGNSDLPYEFPFEFKLVAFIDPIIKKTSVDLKLLDGAGVVTEGFTKVNSPLNWEGLNFYHTATNADDNGNPYIGLQITRDPGLYYVYAGFSIISFGAFLYFIRKVRGLR